MGRSWIRLKKCKISYLYKHHTSRKDEKKTQLPSGVKGKVDHKKNNLTKKGKRAIAPAKARHIEASKLNKSLTLAINKRIEEELTTKASQSELKSLQIIKSQKPKPKHDKPK